MFEIPVQMERNKKSEELAEREKTYMQAQRYMRQSAPGGLNDAMSLTFTQNPGFNVFDQSLNQRIMDTPAFTTGKAAGSLHEFLKDKVYVALKNFTQATRGEPFATWEQYRLVMTDLVRGTSVSDQEISSFWAKHSLNNERFFYKEAFGQLYGSAPARNET